jgi:antibiotic biosynthesis monooxygenase (ABM) superfamily enzyme
MYGTVFRYRLKPGMEQQWLELSREFQQNPPKGFIGAVTYRLDKGGDEYITAAAHSDKASYQENADSPEQHAFYERMRSMMVEDPEWNDGEILLGEIR